MLCYIVSIKAKAKTLSPLNIRLPSQKAMAAGIKSSSKSMLLWRATSWWNQCCYVFCWIVSRYIFGELSWIIYPFCPDIQVFLFMYHPFVDGPLKQCDMFKRTSSPSAYMMSKRPQNMASSRSKMMSDILPPPQDFVKKVSNRKPESNPNHELTIFISLVVPGGEVFSEPPRELKCRKISSKHSFWNPATASGGEGLLFAVPGKSVGPHPWEAWPAQGQRVVPLLKGFGKMFPVAATLED